MVLCWTTGLRLLNVGSSWIPLQRNILMKCLSMLKVFWWHVVRRCIEAHRWTNLILCACVQIRSVQCWNHVCTSVDLQQRFIIWTSGHDGWSVTLTYCSKASSRTLCRWSCSGPSCRPHSWNNLCASTREREREGGGQISQLQQTEVLKSKHPGGLVLKRETAAADVWLIV